MTTPAHSRTEAFVAPLLQAVRNGALAAELRHACFAALYTLTKVRGYKTVLKFFSHEAADLVPILDALAAQRPTDHDVALPCAMGVLFTRAVVDVAVRAAAVAVDDLHDPVRHGRP